MGGGRKKQWQAQQEWQDWPAERRQSQLWHGAWASASPKDASTAIPARYDSMHVPQAKAGASLALAEEPMSTGDTALNREIQRSLTVAKKADVRLRKLQEEKARKTAQWELYAKDVKRKFLNQRKQFENDLVRIQGDMAAAMEAGQDASANLRKVVDQGVPSQMDTSEEDMKAWDELTTEALEPAPSGFLQDAMRTASAARRPPPGMEALPGYPAGAPSAPQGMMTPEAASRLLAAVMMHMPGGLTGPAPSGCVGPHPSMAPPAPTEHAGAPTAAGPANIPTPYVPSPSGRKEEAASPSAAKASPPKRPPTQRVPLRGGPLRPVHPSTGPLSSIQNKLDMRRTAMTPFGLTPDLLATGLQTTVNGQPTAVPTEEIETDGEELPDAHHGPVPHKDGPT